MQALSHQAAVRHELDAGRPAAAVLEPDLVPHLSRWRCHRAHPPVIISSDGLLACSAIACVLIACCLLTSSPILLLLSCATLVATDTAATRLSTHDTTSRRQYMNTKREPCQTPHTCRTSIQVVCKIKRARPFPPSACCAPPSSPICLSLTSAVSRPPDPPA